MAGNRAVIAAFLLVTLAIIGGVIILLSTRPAPVQITILPPVPTATPEPSATPSPVKIYITGAVNQPTSGTITLPSGSRVEDAIQSAGGAAPDADLTKINLAAVLHDGDQVYVPAAGEKVELATPNNGGLVYINTATADQLETLPGIGPAIAGRIIAYRDANGRFNTLDDLDQVEGIGPALIEQLRPLISFE